MYGHDLPALTVCRSGEASHRGVIGGRLERPVAEEFLPDETRDLRARRSTCRGRGCGQRFMQRTGLVEVESEAGVGRRRAVRRRAWFRRRLGSSRVSETGRWTVMQLEAVISLSRRAVGSRAAAGWRVAGWRGSRSCGCARSRAAAGGAGSGAGTHRHPGS